MPDDAAKKIKDSRKFIGSREAISSIGTVESPAVSRPKKSSD